MATASKAFRARAFDANKSMAIYWGPELPDLSECTTGNRAVTQMPSGMEKEEEMESHLQDAILAQQASTSGVQVNHVIPTPKVNQVDVDRYNLVYLNRNKNRSKYIKVHAWQALEKDDPEYDYDTEDEEWLNDHPHIEANCLERIFDTVETNSSETQIASEDSVLNIHKNIDPSVIYEVYEYWLSKRTSAATTSGCIGVGGLIPRVRTECRKDTQGSVNPYVAFRRRAEKMQTRKNRKNDEDSYEKILKLVHDMSKARQLFDMTTKREKAKMSTLDMDTEILAKRMEMSDFGSSTIYNELNEKLRNATKPLVQINGSNQEDKKKKRAKKPKSIDKDLVSKAWLKKNAESWNRPPSIFGHISGQTSSESAKPIREPVPDGKYTFKRRRGCVYRAALPVQYNHQREVQPRPIEQVPQNLRFYETFVPKPDGNMRSIGFARKRIGRGGRIVLDRIPKRSEDERRVPNIYDPWEEECIVDSSRTFGARMHPYAEFAADDEKPTSTQRYFHRSDRVNFKDDTVEKEWSSSYRSSWRDQNENGAEKCELDKPDENLSKSRNAGGGDIDYSEIERMEVDDDDGQEAAQIVTTNGTGGKSMNGVNGNGNHHNEGDVDDDNNKNEDDMDVDVIKSMKESQIQPTPQFVQNAAVLSLPGNELAGRVEPTPVPAKMCGTVSDSDEWREPSGSPSESNSSTEWERVSFKPKTIKVVDDDDEDLDDLDVHEKGANGSGVGTNGVASPSIKDALTVTLMKRKNKFILPPSKIGT